ncbi:MAG: 50S ribosomal protein L13 [Candidatus Marinimicrobia bacterium]|nr:50S ribosomal protein L13 [Candidatus Neomarinimicrobiota bacterium]
MGTYSPKQDELQRDWLLIDAEDKVLGRLAAKVSHLLMGKHKPKFAYHMDGGDFVVIINAEKIKVTGNKYETKKYYRHTGYPGGIKETILKDMMESNPERVIEKAVKGMLPHTKLGRALFRKLKVYAGSDHPHSAQEPKVLEV